MTGVVAKKPHANVRRAQEAREREARAMQLAVQGVSWPDIARQLGYADHSGARQAVQRALNRIPAQAAADYRQRAQEEIDRILGAAKAVEFRDHYAVSYGTLVLDQDGNPVLDDGPKLAAMRVELTAIKQMVELWGSNAPERRVVSVVTDEMVRAYAQDLESRVQAMEAKNAADSRIADDEDEAIDAELVG